MRITKRQLRRIIREEGTRLREAPVPSQRPVPAEEFSNQAYDQGRYAAEGDNVDYDRYNTDTSYAAGVDSFDHGTDMRYEGIRAMKITKRQLRRIICEVTYDDANEDYFREGYADATRYEQPERKYRPEDLSNYNYNEYIDGFEEGLSDRRLVATLKGEPFRFEEDIK